MKQCDGPVPSRPNTTRNKNLLPLERKRQKTFKKQKKRFRPRTNINQLIGSSTRITGYIIPLLHLHLHTHAVYMEVDSSCRTRNESTQVQQICLWQRRRLRETVRSDVERPVVPWNSPRLRGTIRSHIPICGTVRGYMERSVEPSADKWVQKLTAKREGRRRSETHVPIRLTPSREQKTKRLIPTEHNPTQPNPTALYPTQANPSQTT